MQKHFPWRELCYGFALLTLLFGLYVGGYYLFVRRVYLPGGEAIPIYPGRSESLVRFFSLWHECDRTIRSEYWSNPTRPRIMAP